MKKPSMKKIIIIFGVLVGVLLLLLYYQKQGLIKVFPTREEMYMKSVLNFSAKKFRSPEGLTQKEYDKKFGELKEVQERLKKNLFYSPDWITYGNNLEFFNDHKRASEAFEISFKITPTFLAAYNAASVYHYFIKDFEKAETLYNEAIKLNLGFYQAYAGLEDLYRYNVPSKRNEFEPQVLRAIENDPQNTLVYLSDLADFFASQGNDTVKANEYYQKVLERDENEAKILRENYPDIFK